MQKALILVRTGVCISRCAWSQAQAVNDGSCSHLCLVVKKCISRQSVSRRTADLKRPECCSSIIRDCHSMSVLTACGCFPNPSGRHCRTHQTVYSRGVYFSQYRISATSSRPAPFQYNKLRLRPASPSNKLYLVLQCNLT